MGYLGKGPGIRTVLLLRHKSGRLYYVRTLLIAHPLHISCALYLATLQCEQGALFSYREAKKNLETWNGHPRRVNNHTHVKRITDKVGAVLAEHNHIAPAAEKCAAPAQDLLIQIDGGHIPIQEKGKRSFEAYQP